MGRFLAQQTAELPWEVTRPAPPGATVDFGVRRKVLGDEARGPWVRLVEYAPGYQEPAHAHDADEVIYLLAGALQIGTARYGPGTMIFIEAHTTYGPLVAGPEGAQFLLVRPGQADYLPR